ncbi:MAG TPA: Crp/Fnr family transcriptional regulator [Hyphomonadaceae bacterium]|nr:Crp/Fnr family transcriptional regulator [Hyphomonadaceae bacterium]
MSVTLAAPMAPLAMPGVRPVSLRRIASFAPLSLADESLIKRLKPRTLPTGAQLSARAGDDGAAWVILSGWCARTRTLPDGRSQIVHFLLPGDTIGLEAMRWAGDELPVEALTPVIVSDAEPLKSVIKLRLPEHRGLAKACERAAWCEQVYCLNTLVRLGQQTAYERLSHLLLELNTRLSTVGLVNAKGFQLPITQDVMAHALGLSLVHLSRTLRQMRREASIAFGNGQVELLRPDLLAQAANFPHVAAWN